MRVTLFESDGDTGQGGMLDRQISLSTNWITPTIGLNDQYKLSDLRGWYSVNSKTPISEYSGAHGGAPGTFRTYYGPKVMSLEGFVRSTSISDARNAWDVLATMSMGPRVLRVYELTNSASDPNDYRDMTVWVDGGIDILPITATSAKFRIPLYAPDSRKYGAYQGNLVLSSGATAPVSTTYNNPGTADSPLEISVASSTITSAQLPIKVTGGTADLYWGFGATTSANYAVEIRSDFGGTVYRTSNGPISHVMKLDDKIYPYIRNFTSTQTATINWNGGGTYTGATITVKFRPAWW